jgi:hypothetical protein
MIGVSGVNPDELIYYSSSDNNQSPFVQHGIALKMKKEGLDERKFNA